MKFKLSFSFDIKVVQAEVIFSVRLRMYDSCGDWAQVGVWGPYLLRGDVQLSIRVLASLNLPAALEDLSGDSIPPSIAEKARSIVQQGGLQSIEQLIKDLPELLTRNREILDEVRHKHTRWIIHVTALCRSHKQWSDLSFNHYPRQFIDLKSKEGTFRTTASITACLSNSSAVLTKQHMNETLLSSWFGQSECWTFLPLLPEEHTHTLKKLLIIPNGGNPTSRSSLKSNPLIFGPRTISPWASANPFFRHLDDKQKNRREWKQKA